VLDEALFVCSCECGPRIRIERVQNASKEFNSSIGDSAEDTKAPDTS